MSRRAFFDAIARGQPPAGVAFVPWLEELAPRLEGRARAQLTADPTLFTNSVERLTKLIDADAIAIGWDPSLLAEACGLPVHWEDDRPLVAGTAARLNVTARSAARVPAFLETVRRLCATGRAERGCLAGMAGPWSLATRLFGPVPDGSSLRALKTVLVEITEAICQARPDMLVLVETATGTQEPASAEPRRIYATLRNVADHYGVAAAACIEGFEDLSAAAAWLAALKIDHWMLGADSRGRVPDAAEAVRAARGRQSIAVSLPLGDVEEARASAEAALAAARAPASAAVYFTTPGPAPRQTEIGVLRQVGAAIGELSHGWGVANSWASA